MKRQATIETHGTTQPAAEMPLVPFFSSSMLTVYFSSTVISVFTLLLVWPKKSMFEYIRQNDIPLTFSILFWSVLAVHAYINLRCGSGEMIDRGSLPRRELKNIKVLEEKRNFFPAGLTSFIYHTFILFIPFLPVLIISAAVSSVSPGGVAAAIAIVLVTSFLCRVFGFLIYLLFGRWNPWTFFLTRLFFAGFLFLSAYIDACVSPTLLIYHLNINKGSAMRFIPGDAIIFMGIASVITIILLLLIHSIIHRRLFREGPK